MLWLEMSRDELHGGGEWGFTRSLWSPSRKENGQRWAFWENAFRVKAGDSVLHLRGVGDEAAFIGFSSAATDGFLTERRPPSPGQWNYAAEFYRVILSDYQALSRPIKLRRFFHENERELRLYYKKNRLLGANKTSIFFVVQSDRLQCLNGAYLSVLDYKISELIFGAPLDSGFGSRNEYPFDSVITDETVRELSVRVGQQSFSKKVRGNFSSVCCFPGCNVSDATFLVGAHIARWADVPALRGKIENGLCLCLMHDKAFERGLFALSDCLRVKVNKEQTENISWSQKNLLPFDNQPIKQPAINISAEALANHRRRVGAD